MGKLTTAKGLITIVTIPESMQYVLRPSVSQIIIDFNGRPNVNTVTCKAYKAYGSGIEEEVKSSEGTIKYNTSANSELSTYTTDGITVDVNWSFITFYLFINDEPKARVDVPITRNGQVDTNFRVWVGTVADPNSLTDRPWAGVENEDQSDFMHLKDYYVSPDMTYYCFVDDNGVYRWQEVTDINLKRWLARANDSTTGFIIPASNYTSVAGYFSSREYRIGDLWTNATYPMADDANYIKDGVEYTKDKPLYNDEPLICKKSKTGSFTINDWQPISSIKDKLKETGIDIDEYRIVMTADEHWYYNNNGRRVALLNLVNGYPILNTNLLRIDGNVEIDGRVIVGAISENEDASNELSTLLQQQGFSPAEVNFSRDDDGNVVAKIGDNTYTWAEKKTDEVVQYTVKANDGEEHSFSLGTNGLLEAKNAVIQGKIYASEGEFQGVLKSAGGAFGVDALGNVTATSFNGEGVFNSKTTVITKYNFYDYFTKSSLQSEDITGTEWIPNLKKLGHQIRIESLPETEDFPYNDDYDTRAVEITFPRYIQYTDGSISCRRGGLTVGEMFALHNQVYSIETAEGIACNISGCSSVEYGVLVVQYVVHGLDTSAIDNEISVTVNEIATVYLYNKKWQDCETDGSTSSIPEATVPDGTARECTIYIHHINSDENYHYFSWYCASDININDVGNITTVGHRDALQFTAVTFKLKDDGNSATTLQKGKFKVANTTSHSDWDLKSTCVNHSDTTNITYNINIS